MEEEPEEGAASGGYGTLRTGQGCITVVLLHPCGGDHPSSKSEAEGYHMDEGIDRGKVRVKVAVVV